MLLTYCDILLYLIYCNLGCFIEVETSSTRTDFELIVLYFKMKLIFFGHYNNKNK